MKQKPIYYLIALLVLFILCANAVPLLLLNNNKLDKAGVFNIENFSTETPQEYSSDLDTIYELPPIKYWYKMNMIILIIATFAIVLAGTIEILKTISKNKNRALQASIQFIIEQEKNNPELAKIKGITRLLDHYLDEKLSIVKEENGIEKVVAVIRGLDAGDKKDDKRDAGDKKDRRMVLSKEENIQKIIDKLIASI